MTEVKRVVVSLLCRPFRRARFLAVVILGLAVLFQVTGGAFVGVSKVQPMQGEFVPIDELPPEDQLPAAPLLVAAYSFVWLAVFGYIWLLWRRLSDVEREMNELLTRSAGRSQGRS